MSHRYLPEVVSASTDSPASRTLVLHVAPELGYFAGHFPGMPLLPGVVQVDWATRLGRQHLQISGEFASLDNLKFQSVIFPGATITLALEWNPASGRLEFSYSQDGRTLSSGRVHFRVRQEAS